MFEETLPKSVYYRIRIKKGWFRGKDAFTERLFYYERQLKNRDKVQLPLNVGNMIYVMMRRLEAGVDWEKQDALIASYRNLMYRMSYVEVLLDTGDPGCLLFSGQKDDVMWSLSFITQAFPEEPLYCQTVPFLEGGSRISFGIQDGTYIGKNAVQMETSHDALPDIWSFGTELVQQNRGHQDEAWESKGLPYDPSLEPVSGAMFGLPDGRQCKYLRMDERFAYADMYQMDPEGYGLDTIGMKRHEISASLMKDFEDIVRHQTSMDYELYRLRYVALMNKVHELEKKLGGLEISCYDALPIGERGLPYASDRTIARTNELECNSLKYVLEKVKRNQSHMNSRSHKEILKEIGYSVIRRVQGYDVEYQSYQLTGTPESVCYQIRLERCYELYADFAEIDALGCIRFPQSIYRSLCNDPVHVAYQMTDWEKQKLRRFGHGYYDFLKYQLEAGVTRKQAAIYGKAFRYLEERYVKK